MKCFGGEYLRPRSELNRWRILSNTASRGFSGCIGSYNCHNCHCEKCSIDWSRQFKGKQKILRLYSKQYRMESFGFGMHTFGCADSLNDINILDHSKIIVDMLKRKGAPWIWHDINGRHRKLLYYLKHGIYPNWTILVKTVPGAVSEKHNRFATAQEGFFKDVERAFKF